MIEESLFQILEKNKAIKNQLYLRSLLKEKLQDYILNFVYNHPRYKKLIFSGGSCLRKVYGLPRLSEDLDFDYIKELDLAEFAQEIKNYFAKDLQYHKLQLKINSKHKILYIKFPVLAELGLVKSAADSHLLFLRCDFALEEIGIYRTQVSSISTADFTFFVIAYDLSTLFANKIIAFLQRRFFKRKQQEIPFKGRDVFDLVWFFEQSAKSNFALQPNWERVFSKLQIENKEEIWKLLVEKLEKIDKKSLERALLPFIESSQRMTSFSENYLEAIKGKLKYLASSTLS